MKTNLILAAAFVAFCILLVSPSFCPAQMIVGGYKEISKTDETAVAAANFAVKTQAQKDASLKLVSIETIKRQIVAGSNYQMCLVVNSGNKQQQATAMVYHNLQNQFQLTSWTPGNCSAASGANTNQTANSTPASTATTLTPDAVVKNLYAAQKAEQTNPFFQTKNRQLVDKYFTKDFADLIWKDAKDSEAGGGVGALDFDPLYNAQDTQITAFKIGKPEPGEGNLNLADVPVTFKNMGKAETVLFRLEQSAGKGWKISNIFYPGNDESASSLKAILSQ